MMNISEMPKHIYFIFVAVFLGYNQYWPGGFMVGGFYVQEHPKAQPAVVLVLKHLRRGGHGSKSHPTDWEKLGIEPATPGLQDIGLSPTPRRHFATKRPFSCWLLVLGISLSKIIV